MARAIWLTSWACRWCPTRSSWIASEPSWKAPVWRNSSTRRTQAGSSRCSEGGWWPMSTGSFGRGVRPVWVDDKLFPFTSRFVELSGNVVHYVDEGEGPILLMLHGNPTWSFVYRDVIAQLSGSFRCIAPDYPGFGLSSPAPGYQFH